MPSKEKIINHYMEQFNERRRRKKRRRVFVLLFKIIFGVIFTFAIAFFAIRIYQGLKSPMITAVASESSINNEFSIVGYFVRNEDVIKNDTEGIILYSVDDGVKLGRYDEYAAVYSNASAAELRSIIRTYEQQINTLRRALSSIGSADSISNLSAQIYSRLDDCSLLASNYDYSRLYPYTDELKTQIITRELADTSSEKIESLIQALENRCQTLSIQIGTSETSLTVPRSGYFSSRTDGYEKVFDVNRLSLLKPSDVIQLTSVQRTADPNNAGKIVKSFGGYFIANIPSSDMENLRVDQKIKLKLDALGDELVEMTIDSISDPENSMITVVFSYDRHESDLINMRKQSAVVILDTYEGLKVPRDAVRMDEDNKMGVYVITGLFTQFKHINILFETEDYYIVKSDPTNINSLLRGDTIIVGAKNLSDGKVIN